MGREARFDGGPCALERQEVLLAQAVEMQAGDAIEMLGRQLVDGKAQAAVRSAGVVFCDLSLRMQGVDAQADVEAVPGRAGGVEDRAEALMLHRRVEDDVVGQHADFREVCRLVARAISGDFAGAVGAGIFLPA